MAQDPEAYDCESCAWRAWHDRLGEDDHAALVLYTVLSQPVVQDLKLVPFVFEAFGLEMTRNNAIRLVDKLALIHACRRPARQSVDPGGNE